MGRIDGKGGDRKAVKLHGFRVRRCAIAPYVAPTPLWARRRLPQRLQNRQGGRGPPSLSRRPGSIFQPTRICLDEKCSRAPQPRQRWLNRLATISSRANGLSINPLAIANLFNPSTTSDEMEAS